MLQERPREEKKEGRESQKRGGRARDLTRSEKHVRKCKTHHSFIYPSEQLFVCLSLSLSGTAVQRGHQLAVGFVIQEERSRSPTVHCLQKEKQVLEITLNLPSGHNSGEKIKTYTPFISEVTTGKTKTCLSNLTMFS